MSEAWLSAVRPRRAVTGAREQVGALLWRTWTFADHLAERALGHDDRSRDDVLALSFKSDAVAIEEAPIPVSAHAALHAVVLLLVLALLWSVFGTIDRTVVARGEVATQTPQIVMQPFALSRVLQIRVEPGDRVRKGQVLATFDPAFARADLAALAQKHRALAAQTARLTAELNGTRFVYQGDVTARTEAQIFQQETAEYAAEMAERDRRAAELDAQIKADDGQIDGLGHQLRTANKVVGIYKYLLSQKAAAPLDLMKSQDSAVDAEMRLTAADGDRAKLLQQKAEIEAERRSFIEHWRSDRARALAQARQDLADADAALGKANTMSDLTEMRAPADATVLDVADRSQGSVVREAETLITLVPDGAQLFMKADIPARDIGHLKVGDKVRIKLDAYPFQRYGTLDGRLAVLGPDVLPSGQNDTSPPVYRARIRIQSASADLIARGVRLRPGLVATAQVTTGRRSIISYVLSPMLETSDEALRER